MVNTMGSFGGITDSNLAIFRVCLKCQKKGGRHMSSMPGALSSAQLLPQ
jgi:hypothetical protein